MAASITFTDAVGAVTVSNGFPAPGDRFSGWQILTTQTENGAGVQRQALGTGLTYHWAFRTDYGAKFSLRYIPSSAQADLARLKRWLESGGEVVVDTNDNTTNQYTCTLWPGSRVEISPPDPKDLRLTVTLSVRNTAAVDCVCDYS